MSWFRRFLVADEPVLIHARVHPMVCGTALILAFGFFGFLYGGIAVPRTDPGSLESEAICLIYVAGLFWLLTMLYTLPVILFIAATEFVVTDRRLLGSTGLFGALLVGPGELARWYGQNTRWPPD